MQEFRVLSQCHSSLWGQSDCRFSCLFFHLSGYSSDNRDPTCSFSNQFVVFSIVYFLPSMSSQMSSTPTLCMFPCPSLRSLTLPLPGSVVAFPHILAASNVAHSVPSHWLVALLRPNSSQYLTNTNTKTNT